MGATREARDEEARLAALHYYRILDTEAEEDFDDIAELARHVCDVPVALVTFVDAKRQWFKARSNFEVPETAREIAFCAHAILEGRVLVVADATSDARFHDNPLVTGPPYIRFYAGAPMIVDGRHALGTVAVLDYVPRVLDEEKQRALAMLARRAVSQLELRRRSAHVLRESASQESAIVSASLDAILVIDHDGVVTNINPAAEQTFGHTRAEVIGKKLVDVLVPHSLRADHRAGFARFLATGQAQILNRRIETRALRADGVEIPIELTVTRLGQSDPPRFVGFMRDLSERARVQKLEEQLRQSQKLDAMGQLSGGVAHDFNNLLTVIQFNAAIIADADDSGEIKESAAQIQDVAERGARLTKQLLLASRSHAMQTTGLDLNAIARHLVTLLERVLGEDISLRCEYADSLPTLHGDVGMLEQVLLNLVVNARDAMPQGGSLTISTSVVVVEESQAQRHHEASAGACGCLRVRDSGNGIPEAVLPRIFEPFFTTKEVGRGTGLGLATVHGIVRQHGGWIEVDSVLGEGTTFSVFLPVRSASLRPGGGMRRGQLVRSLGGTETILVVEDEQAVRSLVSNLLRRHGYEVLEASCGVAALEIWDSHRDRISLLLTDLVMPGGMTGRELAEHLRRDRPSLKVIYSSGYSAELAGLSEGLGEVQSLLQKPYRPERLAATVRECLDREGQ